MPAKKTAKKKLTPRAEANKRYRANKVAREAAALIDSVIQPVIPQPNPDYQDSIEPTITAHPDVYGDADDFNEFAPNMGMGEDPIDQEMGDWKNFEHIETGEDDEITLTSAEMVEVELDRQIAASLPSPAPVVTSVAAFDQLIANAPPEPEKSPVLPETLEPPSDALVVERLINGINHLYTIAKTVKGMKGLKVDHAIRIQSNLIQARALLARLK